MTWQTIGAGCRLQLSFAASPAELTSGKEAKTKREKKERGGKKLDNGAAFH